MADQYVKQLSELIFQRNTPSVFFLLSNKIACEGQTSAHFLQIVQKSITDEKSLFLSVITGISVVTTAILTLGPSLGVINNPILPISPNPASRATNGQINS